MTTILLIAGTRTITDREFVFEKLDYITDELDIDVVIEGEARGPDRLGREWAKSVGIPVVPFHAPWDMVPNKRGGFVRNWMQAQAATHAVVFWDGKSTGTKHMLDVLASHQIPTRLVRTDIEEE